MLGTAWIRWLALPQTTVLAATFLGPRACAEDLPVPLASRLPENCRVLYALGGRAALTLGTALLAVEDCSGDGVRDVLLGASERLNDGGELVKVLLLSGRDGELLHVLELGRDEGLEPGVLGCYALGDTDGDGRRDFAFMQRARGGAERILALYSGSTWALRYRLLLRTKLAEPPLLYKEARPDFATSTAREVLGPLLQGPCLDIGDLDGDLCADYFVGGWLCSGKSGAAMGQLPARPVGLIRERYGSRELLVQSPWQLGIYEWCNLANGKVAQSISLNSNHEPYLAASTTNAASEFVVASEYSLGEDGLGGHPHCVELRCIDATTGKIRLAWRQRGRVGHNFHFAWIGDIDGDGREDCLTRTGPESAPNYSYVVFTSGADGRILAELALESRDFATKSAVLGDVDGDGRAELLLLDPQAALQSGDGQGVVYALSWN